MSIFNIIGGTSLVPLKVEITLVSDGYRESIGVKDMPNGYASTMFDNMDEIASFTMRLRPEVRSVEFTTNGYQLTKSRAAIEQQEKDLLAKENSFRESDGY